MKIEKRIQKELNKKGSRLVRITSRNRSANGFDVIRPDGMIYHAPNKKEALNHLLVQVKTAYFPKWKLVVHK